MLHQSSIITNEQFSLEELIQSKRNTEEHFFNQFDIKEARVKKLIKSIGEANCVFVPLRVGKVAGDNNYYLIGGRHRTEALEALYSEGYDDIEYEVLVTEVMTKEILLDLILHDNGSRSMTRCEQKSLDYQVCEGEYERDGNFPSGITNLKNHGVFYYEVSSKGTCTPDTTLKIWGRVITNLKKKDPSFGKKLSSVEELQADFALAFQHKLVEVLKPVQVSARTYTLYADKISKQLVEEGVLELADKYAVSVKQSRKSKIDKETYDWIHSEKLAESLSKQEDLYSLRQLAEQEALQEKVENTTEDNSEEKHEETIEEIDF